MAEQREEVALCGGHEAFLQRRAKLLLPLFPAGISRELFESDTPVFWEDAAARIKQCARCPSYGGACAGGNLAWPEGEVISKDEQKGLRGDACAKWKTWLVRSRLMSSNVPAHLATPLGHAPEAFSNVMRESSRTREPRWFFVTGGDPRRHAAAVVPMLYELSELHRRTSWFEVSAGAFSKAIDNRKDPSSPDPFDRLRTAHVLAFVIITPERWKDWFVEAMDEVLSSRHSKTTIIAYAKSSAELSERLPLTSMLLTNATELALS